jgi:hypothetical protein
MRTSEEKLFKHLNRSTCKLKVIIFVPDDGGNSSIHHIFLLINNIVLFGVDSLLMFTIGKL